MPYQGLETDGGPTQLSSVALASTTTSTTATVATTLTLRAKSREASALVVGTRDA